MLLTSLALEREVFAAGNVALGKIDLLPRRTRLWLLGCDADALHGIGLPSMRRLQSIDKEIIAIETGNPTLRQYRDTVRYLARVPEWGSRALEYRRASRSNAGRRSIPARPSTFPTGCAEVRCSTTARCSTRS